MKTYSFAFNGNGYTGGRLAAKAMSRNFSHFGKGLGMYGYYDTYNKYQSNEYSGQQTFFETASNTYSTWGGIPGGAWGIGWELGRCFTKTNWYHTNMYLIYNPGGRDGLITTPR